MNKGFVAVFGLFLLAGCERTHLSPNFGVADRAAFRAQVIDPKAGNVAKPDPPLDPEEAAVISHTYLHSLAPANATDPNAPRSPIVVVPTPSSGAGAGMQPGGMGPPQ